MSNNHKYRAVPGNRVEVKFGDVEKALRIFTKKVQNSGILNVLKDKEAFTSPSQKARLKHQMAVVRERKRKQKSEERKVY